MITREQQIKAILDRAAAILGGEWLDCTGAYGDLLQAVPLDPTIPRDEATLTAGVLSGVLLAAISQQAQLMSKELRVTPGVKINAVTLTRVFGNDIAADLLFDGVGHDGQIITLAMVRTMMGEELGTLTHRVADDDRRVQLYRDATRLLDDAISDPVLPDFITQAAYAKYD